MARPRVDCEGQKELDKVEDVIDDFKTKMKSYNPIDNRKNVDELEPIVKMSNAEMQKFDAPYIRPIKSVNRAHSNSDDPKTPKVYWNDKYQRMHDYDWEYVKCKVENREVVNDDLEVWTAKYGCDPAHLWRVPVNKPIYIPRLLASQLAQCKYNKIVMDTLDPQKWAQHSNDAVGSYVGGCLMVEQTVNRINAVPISSSF